MCPILAQLIIGKPIAKNSSRFHDYLTELEIGNIIYLTNLLFRQFMEKILKNTPLHFSADLTNEHLSIISRLFLDARSSALKDTNTELDDKYTQSTVTFGRQRQIMIKTCNKGLYSWLSIAHSGNDLIFGIGSIRNIRFFMDDSSQPKKPRVFKPTVAELKQLPVFEPNSNDVVLWRFIIEPAINDDYEDTVHFVGINEFHEIICHWTYEDSVRVLYSIDDSTPPQKELLPASVTGKSENDGLEQKQDDV